MLYEVITCENVLESALMHQVSKVVVLSTDKAVYPVNAMGMSKALSEKVMIAKSRALNGCGTVFCGTRYGNVIVITSYSIHYTKLYEKVVVSITVAMLPP